MITTKLVLSVGHFDGKKFHAYDDYDLEIQDYNKSYACENCNDILNGHLDREDYAELRLVISTVKHEGFLIATFKRLPQIGRGQMWLLSV